MMSPSSALTTANGDAHTSSALLASHFFASREDSFGTPGHHGVFSDSVASLSPLRSQRRVANETNHLTPFGCGRKAARYSTVTLFARLRG